jgi:hypothetical protein
MDSHILSVWGMRDFTEASRADSMGAFLERRYSSRLKVGVADTWRDVVRGELSFAGVKAAACWNVKAKRAARR